MDREKFSGLVEKAVKNLPEDFLARLDNIDVVVADAPTPKQSKKAGIRKGGTLLGLYEGVPLTRRGAFYQLAVPDKITIFQLPIEARCGDERRIYAEIEKVLRHEIAHHFGISDERLKEIGKY
jgi:predicted Zn-dependent protease with MMP-like domain